MEPQAKNILQQAIKLHRNGQLERAKSIYENILENYPNHFDALHLLGVIALQTRNYLKSVDLISKAVDIYPSNAEFYYNRGIALSELKQFDAAIKDFDQAIAIKPSYAEAHSNHGNANNELGQFDAAIQSFNRAIAIKPNFAEAYSNRGNALAKLIKFDAAVESYDRAITLRADYAEAHYNRANVLNRLKQFEAAIASYDRAIAIKPKYAEAYSNRGNALVGLKRNVAAVKSYDQAIAIKPNFAEAYTNRGNALSDIKQFDAAIESYDQATAIKPDYAEALCNRGNVLKELKRFDAAVESYDRAIAITPGFAEAHYNRGIALRELKQFDAAIESYDRAIVVAPDFAEAYSNRGNAQREFMQLDDAIESYGRAIAIKPDFAEAYWNKSLVLLLKGDFVNGWDLHEWRWKLKDFPSQIRNFTQPLWLGREQIVGKTILLHAEQGLGDTIQFCRYVKLVADLGARVILEVPRSLIGLLDGLAGISTLVVKETSLPPFDYHCPLLSLPLAFKTTAETIPSSRTYLSADTNKIKYWESKLSNKTKLRIGLAWSGRITHTNDSNRSICLETLIDAIGHDYDYVSLQKELRNSDSEIIEINENIRHFGDDIEDFTDTAALCALMDVVISVDTSVAHLSGALGKQTWVLLPFHPDWRWLLDRDDSPWYPSVKLYRQPSIGDWDTALANVKADLGRIQF